ncbi:Flp family type IVb pilin [Roseomonas sp. KE2513]|nr:Flp family type IVb pilin [Roseomonas sp. KE2513]
MGKALVLLTKLQSDRKGVTALEYGIIASVVVVAVAAALTQLDFTTFFGSVMTKVNGGLPK